MHALPLLRSIETVADREGPEAAGGERNVADLLLDQVAAVLSLPTRHVLCYSSPPCCATRQEA